MAASDSAPRTSSSADDADESAAGMAHLTVVPANFDPDDSSATDE
ncbi:hypothetical protein NP511_21995 [Natrinema thermotolerans]|uniref:Uncharacterized protein n=1 Tax=Natrinema thermotolerans TaxID=121872 RepID=A0AAF0P8I5_9EURY|nr:hypothetical protein [Natrinema thermotolerans]ELZ09743.1 hypothetical protein C478_16227 [Natrinema thermotolerans DSM 11552]WMT07388.1 hypothetical protein NP511_18635 [Natrinema thermotolerans]WMT08020.1 hypothetical protein NP511_21995 [Natrinema thermotolerans]